jgi:hypothetical protein
VVPVVLREMARGLDADNWNWTAISQLSRPRFGEESCEIGYQSILDALSKPLDDGSLGAPRTGPIETSSAVM